MNLPAEKPSWVIEQVVDPAGFDCCGDQDLFPFKCASCGHPLVVCYECDTLYAGLPDVAVSAPFSWAKSDGTGSRCPSCTVEIPRDFMHAPANRISFAEWSAHGLDQLLAPRSVPDLLDGLSAEAQVISDYLSRGMLSSAKRRLRDVRNLADAMSDTTPNAAVYRLRGKEVMRERPLADALSWQSTIADPVLRAYALLGIAEAAVD